MKGWCDVFLKNSLSAGGEAAVGWPGLLSVATPVVKFCLLLVNFSFVQKLFFGVAVSFFFALGSDSSAVRTLLASVTTLLRGTSGVQPRDSEQ